VANLLTSAFSFRRTKPTRAKIERFVTRAYELILKRPPDAEGLEHHTRALRLGDVSPLDFVQGMFESPEYQSVGKLGALQSLHQARQMMVRQLPKADTILDLGGAADDFPAGALVLMGYPYPFRRLTIVEPPRDYRHDIYRDVVSDETDTVQSPLGEVRYHFGSMADLSAFADASIDLVFSGESFEHVTRDEAQIVLREALRVLKPGGSFCFDTPNRAITGIQCPECYINPDHKYEYTADEIFDMVAASGMTVSEAKGICRMPKTVESGVFDAREMVENCGLYDDVPSCYLMYFRCRAT
jgi:hypothetical protein